MTFDRYGYSTRNNFKIFVGDDVRDSAIVLDTDDAGIARAEIKRRKAMKLHRVIYVQSQVIHLCTDVAKTGDAEFMNKCGVSSPPVPCRGPRELTAEEMRMQLDTE